MDPYLSDVLQCFLEAASKLSAICTHMPLVFVSTCWHDAATNEQSCRNMCQLKHMGHGCQSVSVCIDYWRANPSADFVHAAPRFLMTCPEFLACRFPWGKQLVTDQLG